MTAETIDLTPTWREILPTMLTIQRDASPAGVAAARPEFNKMAALADHANALRTKLQELVDAFPDDEDEEVDGADTVNWVLAYRAEIKTLLAAALV